MQVNSDTPKSYSLIYQLQPSVSLDGEVSQRKKKFRNNESYEKPVDFTPQINSMIENIESLSFDQLKQKLGQVLEAFSNNESMNTKFHQKNKISQNSQIQEDLVTLKLKQLALISEVLKQRMQQKLVEVKFQAEKFTKTIVDNAKLIKMRNTKPQNQNKKGKKQEDHIHQSQKTSKIGERQNNGVILLQTDIKKTKKTDQKIN